MVVCVVVSRQFIKCRHLRPPGSGALHLINLRDTTPHTTTQGVFSYNIQGEVTVYHDDTLMWHDVLSESDMAQLYMQGGEML